MSLLDFIFPNKKKRDPVSSGIFQTLTAYTPVFRTWNGEIYESELVRAAIDAKARHISKLGINIQGSAQPKLTNKLKYAPNNWQTWSQFFYRLETILEVKNTAFIVKVYDDYMEQIGLACILPQRYELINVNGTPWIRFSFSHGEYAADSLSNIGVMTKFQLDSDYFGNDNTALNETMQLITIQRQGIEEAAKNANTYRFTAQMNNYIDPEDLAKDRKQFNENNFSDGEGGGLLLFPNNYKDIKQITPSNYSVDAAETEQIRTNVFNYFGVNEKILQNSAIGDDLDAFFNGAIEPFCIQFSDVVTQMTYSQYEQSRGAKIMATSNRLQYMNTQTKISMAQQLGDRGMILIDEIRELFNYPPLPDGRGQHAPIRGEFKYAGENSENTDPPAQDDGNEPAETDPADDGGDDDGNTGNE